METVTKFKANDGRVFDSADDCMRHEQVKLEIEQVMSLLKPVPSDTGFANGEGFVQQDIHKVTQAMVRIVELADLKDVPAYPSFMQDPFAGRWGIIGRFINDGDNRLWAAWSRFMSIDDFGREWGQPYYASHPEAGTQREVTV